MCVNFVLICTTSVWRNETFHKMSVGLESVYVGGTMSFNRVNPAWNLSPRALGCSMEIQGLYPGKRVPAGPCGLSHDNPSRSTPRPRNSGITHSCTPPNSGTGKPWICRWWSAGSRRSSGRSRRGYIRPSRCRIDKQVGDARRLGRNLDVPSVCLMVN